MQTAILQMRPPNIFPVFGAWSLSRLNAKKVPHLDLGVIKVTMGVVTILYSMNTNDVC